MEGLRRMWDRFRAWFRGAGRGAQIAVVVGALVIGCCACGTGIGIIDAAANGGSSAAQTSGEPSPTATPRQATASPASASKPTTTPEAQKLSAAQKQQVAADLNAGLAYYVDTWHQGQQILGTTQYADATAGLNAMADPNSAASRFSAWRQSSKIEQNITTYLNAFNSADAFYTADNEPSAIGSYRDDMGTLQADISTWVTDAVGWQIHQTDNATMTQDVQTINTDINQVKADIAATLAAS